MRADDCKPTRQTSAITRDAIGRKERAGIVRPLISFRFTANQFHISLRQAKRPVGVVICNALDECLSSAQRDGNKLAKDSGIANSEHANDKQGAAKQDERWTKSSASWGYDE